MGVPLGTLNVINSWMTKTAKSHLTVALMVPYNSNQLKTEWICQSTTRCIKFSSIYCKTTSSSTTARKDCDKKKKSLQQSYKSKRQLSGVCVGGSVECVCRQQRGVEERFVSTLRTLLSRDADEARRPLGFVALAPVRSHTWPGWLIWLHLFCMTQTEVYLRTVTKWSQGLCSGF